MSREGSSPHEEWKWDWDHRRNESYEDRGRTLTHKVSNDSLLSECLSDASRQHEEEAKQAVQHRMVRAQSSGSISMRDASPHIASRNQSSWRFFPPDQEKTVDPARVNIWRDGIPSFQDLGLDDSESLKKAAEQDQVSTPCHMIQDNPEHEGPDSSMPPDEGKEPELWDPSTYQGGGCDASITTAVAAAVQDANSSRWRPSSTSQALRGFPDDMVLKLSATITDSPPVSLEEAAEALEARKVVKSIRDVGYMGDGPDVNSPCEQTVAKFLTSLYSQGYVLKTRPAEPRTA